MGFDFSNLFFCWWFTCIVGKKGRGKERKKKIEREKTKLVLFVCSLCLVQSLEL